MVMKWMLWCTPAALTAVCILCAVCPCSAVSVASAPAVTPQTAKHIYTRWAEERYCICSTHRYMTAVIHSSAVSDAFQSSTVNFSIFLVFQLSLFLYFRWNTHSHTHSIFLYHLQAPQQPCIHWLEVNSRRQRLEMTLDRDVIHPSNLTLPLFLICKGILDKCVWRLLSFTLHLCLHVSVFLSISVQSHLQRSLKIFQTCFGP